MVAVVILPSVAMLWAEGAKDRREELGPEAEANFIWAKLWMKKLRGVASEPRLASMCLEGSEEGIRFRRDMTVNIYISVSHPNK